MRFWSMEIVVGCMLLAAYVDGRTMGRRPHRQRKRTEYVPVLRSMDDIADPLPATSLVEKPTSTKFLLLKKNNHHQFENAVGDGRTLKHLFMVKGLASAFAGSGGGGGYGGGGGGHGGGGNGYMLPYIIVNTPTNVTNVNNNSVSNVVPTTTGTPTTPPGRRGSYFFNSAAMPYQRQSTPVTHQRENNYEYINQNNQLPFNIAMPTSVPIGMMNINGELMPLMLPNNNNNGAPAPNRRRRGGQRHRGVNNNYSNDSGNTDSKDINPFVAFANSLKRIQFL